MFKCKCGCSRFYAHQVCHVGVVVDGDNYFLENQNDNMDEACYHADNPFGPYECEDCGHVYDTLESDDDEETK